MEKSPEKSPEILMFGISLTAKGYIIRAS